MSESYWVIPADAGEKAPVTMLREQANALTEATSGRLRGRVETLRMGDRLSISLMVVVPALDGYEVQIISYDQSTPLIYPGRLMLIGDEKYLIIRGEEEFNAAFKAALSSNRIQKVISSLLSQTKSA
jgi:hypothetical protein